MELLFKEVIPEQLTCDNGSEFTSNKFIRLMKDNNVKINYVNINDHNRLGVVDRFIQTLRNKLNKYMSAYDTTKYINKLNDIIDNYNNSFNSGIKSIPNKPDIEGIKKVFTEKYIKALDNENKFNIGDKVRHILNKQIFEKGSQKPKWSKTIYNIIGKNVHSYLLSNQKEYKYYELQLAPVVEKIEPIKTRAMSKEPKIEQIKRANTIKRRLKKEDINLEHILPTRLRNH
jgi:hypothetical protein